MSDPSDFYLDNEGVRLRKYVGPGGDVTVPAGVKELWYGCFHDCEKLTGIVLPEGVTEIRPDADDGGDP